MDTAFTHCSECCAISPIPVGRKASFTGSHRGPLPAAAVRMEKGRKLPHVFLFSILAVMAGANSYRAIHSFIDVHLHRLKQTFGLNWRRAPAYTTGARAFRVLRRATSRPCSVARTDPERERRVPSHARGRLRRQDVARQLRQVHRHPAGPPGSAPSPPTAPWCWAHLEIDDKSNEIPAVQRRSVNSRWPRAWSPWMRLHCQKVSFERAAQRARRPVGQVDTFWASCPCSMSTS